jgi:hypothetical protein
MRRGRVADVRDPRAAEIGDGILAHQRHFLRVTGVADDRRRVIGKYAEHGRQVADVAVHAPERAAMAA